MLEDHLFININTGRPVKPPISRPRFLPEFDYFADCDLCDSQIIKESRATATGFRVTRFICECACRVEVVDVNLS